MDSTEQLTEELLKQMSNISSLVHKAYTGNELHRGEFFLLNAIAWLSQDGQTVNCSCLSERLHISKPAVSKLLNILEKKGYVERRMDPEDRRAVQVLPTSLGTEILNREYEVVHQFAWRVTQRFGLEKTEHFVASCREIYGILEQEIAAQNTLYCDKISNERRIRC